MIREVSLTAADILLGLESGAQIARLAVVLGEIGT